jgi:hypothetical protein
MTPKCHVLTSNQSAHLSDSGSFVTDLPSLRNMIYLKAYWNVDVFQEKEPDFNKVMYDFIRRGSDMIYSIPFIKYSFQYSNFNNLDTTLNNQLDFDLSTILDERTKNTFKSFDKPN